MPGVRFSLFDRFTRQHGESAAAPASVSEAAPTVVQIDVTSLSRVFSAPMWLRDLGLLAWFLVGVAILIVGMVWLLDLTSTIVVPVTLGAILATVAGPLVAKLQRHRIPRAAGAAIVLLLLLTITVVIALMVFGGIYEQSSEIKASSTSEQVKSSTAQTGKTLLQGLSEGIKGVTSLVFFLTFTVFSTFFLLKDGPAVRRFVDRNLGVPLDVATIITGNVMRSLRRYFLGVTYVAGFNAIVVGLAALVLDVPLAGTIAVVVFVTAYVPYIGAFVSGAFAVMLALASQGTTTALIMLVVVILANGLLQNIVQPLAFGATLDLNPLVVLIVTIGLGSIFGMIGMVLAAPLTSAALHISRELAQVRAVEAAAAAPEPSAAV